MLRARSVEVVARAGRFLGGGLAQPFASLINFRGAPPLSRFVRQGGGLDFLCQ